MPPKKRLIAKRSASSQLPARFTSGNLSKNDNDHDDSSLISNTSTTSKRSLKVVALLKKSRKAKSSGLASAHSLISELENDDGFVFKRSGKPISTTSVSGKTADGSGSSGRRSQKRRILSLSKLLEFSSSSEEDSAIQDSSSVSRKPQQSLSRSNTKNGSSLASLKEGDGLEDSSLEIIETKAVKGSRRKNSDKKATLVPKSKLESRDVGKVTKRSKAATPTQSRKISTRSQTDLSFTEIPSLKQSTLLSRKRSFGSPGEKEPLQISESPINRRNKEMRAKSGRRSSLGNRGKRTSSIGNGFEVAPHDDVLPSNFYKHLDQDLPEPHRMRQLLLWCLKRQLIIDNKNLAKQKQAAKVADDDTIAAEIAKVIKEELVSDLVNGKIQTSWWNREDEESEDVKHKTIKIVPNQRNVDNAKSLKIYEQRAKKLAKENDEWDSLKKKYESRLQLPIPLEDETDEDVRSELLQKHYKKNSEIVNVLKTEEELSHARGQLETTVAQQDEDYELAFEEFGSLVDMLSFNDAVMRNFEYNRRKQAAGILLKYLQNPDQGSEDENLDDIDLLRGITQVGNRSKL